MNTPGNWPAIHLRPRSRRTPGPAIGNDAPVSPDGALTAPGLIHRSLAVMDSRR